MTDKIPSWADMLARRHDRRGVRKMLEGDVMRVADKNQDPWNAVHNSYKDEIEDAKSWQDSNRDDPLVSISEYGNEGIEPRRADGHAMMWHTASKKLSPAERTVVENIAHQMPLLAVGQAGDTGWDGQYSFGPGRIPKVRLNTNYASAANTLPHELLHHANKMVEPFSYRYFGAPDLEDLEVANKKDMDKREKIMRRFLDDGHPMIMEGYIKDPERARRFNIDVSDPHTLLAAEDISQRLKLLANKYKEVPRFNDAVWRAYTLQDLASMYGLMRNLDTPPSRDVMAQGSWANDPTYKGSSMDSRATEEFVRLMLPKFYTDEERGLPENYRVSPKLFPNTYRAYDDIVKRFADLINDRKKHLGDL